MGVWNNVPSPNSGGISSLLFDVKIEYTHATANSALYQQQFARLHKADQRIGEPELPFSSHRKNIFSSCVTFQNARFADNSILPPSFLILLLHCKSMLLFEIKVGALLTNNGLKFWNAPKLWSNSSLFLVEVSTRWWNVSNSFLLVLLFISWRILNIKIYLPMTQKNPRIQRQRSVSTG